MSAISRCQLGATIRGNGYSPGAPGSSRSIGCGVPAATDNRLVDALGLTEFSREPDGEGTADDWRGDERDLSIRSVRILMNGNDR